MPTDEEIFVRICSIFKKLEYALNEHDFHYGIRAETFDEMFEYARTNDPMEEFVDKRFERERRKLIAAVKDFRKDFCIYVSLDGEYFYPSLHFQKGFGLTEDQLEELEKEIDILNKKSTVIWNTYKDFVRKIRKMAADANIHTVGEENVKHDVITESTAVNEAQGGT